MEMEIDYLKTWRKAQEEVDSGVHGDKLIDRISSVIRHIEILQRPGWDVLMQLHEETPLDPGVFSSIASQCDNLEEEAVEVLLGEILNRNGEPFWLAFLMRDKSHLCAQFVDAHLSWEPEKQVNFLLWVGRLVPSYELFVKEKLEEHTLSGSNLREGFTYCPGLRDFFWEKILVGPEITRNLTLVWTLLGHYHPMGKEAYDLLSEQKQAP